MLAVLVVGWVSGWVAAVELLLVGVELWDDDVAPLVDPVLLYVEPVPACCDCWVCAVGCCVDESVEVLL